MKLATAAALSLCAGAAFAEPAVTIRNNGPVTNRINMVIIGDGYTSAEMVKYSSDVDVFVNGIFAQVSGDPDRAVSLIQRTIQSTSTVPLYAKVRTYQDLIDPQLSSWRLGATLFSVFSALALGIAAVGLFGVVSYLMTQRTREIGVRIALGATQFGLSRMVVGDAVRLVVAGVVAGALAALAGGPFIRDLLFQTSPWEAANLATGNHPNGRR